MSYRPYQKIERRKSRLIHVGRVPVGGDSPISVQTMTNTPTEDAAATIAQIRRSELAGVDIVRVSCPTEEATAALAEIVREVNVPIVADIHFHYRRAIEAAQAGAAESLNNFLAATGAASIPPGVSAAPISATIYRSH